MIDDDGNGQPARRYVVVDHDGKRVELPSEDRLEITFTLLDLLGALPVGGRFTVTRVS